MTMIHYLRHLGDAAKQRKIASLLMLLFSCCLPIVAPLHAQGLQYDPLLDPAVTVLESPQRLGSGEFLWHPGQLSAHLQQKRLKESAQRCLNVGYPGKFYAPVKETTFRKEVRLSAETVMEWSSTGRVRLTVDGATYDGAANTVRLPKGKHTLLFEVTTEDDIPAVKVKFDGQCSTDGWDASIDGTTWSAAETSPVFGTAGRMPLDDPEVGVEIKPVAVVSVSNATVSDGRIKIGKNGYVLVDFFHLEIGKVSVTAKGAGQLTAFVGESPQEALNENAKLFEQRPIAPYALTAAECQLTLPERAVRYVAFRCDEDCEISGLKLTAKVWPVDFKMSFDCDDERVNKIWRASVATLHTSTHGFYLDGVKRDYLPWAMDAVVSTFAGDYVFADEQVTRNCLSVAMLPLHPQKSDIGIVDYPLHGLIGFYHYYLRYGDMKGVTAYRDRIEQLLKFYESQQDERGFITAKTGASGFIPGWATKQGPDGRGTPAYAQMMLYCNFKIGAAFAEKWGDKKAAKHYMAKAQSLKDSIVQHFLDEEQGLFLNGYKRNGELDKTISHHAQYWAILAGIFPQRCYDNLFERLPKIPHYMTDVSYEKGYEFLAYSKARKVEQMWNFLFTVFGDWLEQGHTRFPENLSYTASREAQLSFYGRPYGLSLCHGANGVPGIVAVLNGIAGFSQSETHPNHYTLQPDLMHLKWANIAFPVKEGQIKLKLTKEGTSQIEIPRGCKVDLIFKNKKTTFSKGGIYNV